jgi:hypothetical protein
LGWFVIAVLGSFYNWKEWTMNSAEITSQSFREVNWISTSLSIMNLTVAFSVFNVKEKYWKKY